MHMGAPTTKSGRLSMDADSRHRLESDRKDSPLNKLRAGLARMDTMSALRQVADGVEQDVRVELRHKFTHAPVVCMISRTSSSTSWWPSAAWYHHACSASHS